MNAREFNNDELVFGVSRFGHGTGKRSRRNFVVSFASSAVLNRATARFDTEGSRWRDEYHLKPCGLME